MFLRLICAIAASCLILMPTAKAVADTFDTTLRNIVEVRVYSDGSLVFHFSPGFGSGGPGCYWNDYSWTPTSAPAYKLLSSLALTAYTSHRQVYLIYNACSSPGSTYGNVYVTGLILAQQ